MRGLLLVAGYFLLYLHYTRTGEGGERGGEGELFFIDIFRNNSRPCGYAGVMSILRQLAARKCVKMGPRWLRKLATPRNDNRVDGPPCCCWLQRTARGPINSKEGGGKSIAFTCTISSSRKWLSWSIFGIALYLRLQMVKLFHIFRFPRSGRESYSRATKWVFGALFSKNEGCILPAAVGKITTEHDSFLEPGFL